MTVLKKDKDDVDTIGCLALGTESRKLIILDPTASTVMKQVTLPSVPVFLATHGAYDLDYRVIVACRNGSIYTLKGGEVSGVVIELDSQPCGLLRMDKSIVVGTMNNALHYYHTRVCSKRKILPSRERNNFRYMCRH
jgi:Bardet-Biedl syndrome 1 protein